MAHSAPEQSSQWAIKPSDLDKTILRVVRETGSASLTMIVDEVWDDMAGCPCADGYSATDIQNAVVRLTDSGQLREITVRRGRNVYSMWILA